VRWRDRVIGIVLGLILGAGIVTAFVFIYSEETVDAPSISRNGTSHRAGRDGGGPAPGAVATVRVINGAPPSQGPAALHFDRDQIGRLRVVSDRTVDVELTGYGITRTVEAGKPALIRFRASVPGGFALVVAGSEIAVAQIRVGGPSV
jgi:hypothetical protein